MKQTFLILIFGFLAASCSNSSNSHIQLKDFVDDVSVQKLGQELIDLPYGLNALESGLSESEEILVAVHGSRSQGYEWVYPLMIFKSVANKSALKVYIIQSTDRKLPLEDIASAKGLKMQDLIDEMDRIVQSGTKINIDYYLEDIMDEESIEEVFDFLTEECESGSMMELLEEFGEDYDENELQLLRLKFFSDVAN